MHACTNTHTRIREHTHLRTPKLVYACAYDTRQHQHHYHNHTHEQDSINRYPVSYAAEPPPVDATRSHTATAAATSSATRSVAAAPATAAASHTERREASPYEASTWAGAGDYSGPAHVESGDVVGGLGSMVPDSSGSKSAVPKVRAQNHTHFGLNSCTALICARMIWVKTSKCKTYEYIPLQAKTSSKSKTVNSKFAKQMEKWKTKRSELEVCDAFMQHSHVRTYTNMCVCVHIYIYMYIYMHTYIHTYIQHVSE